MMFRGVLLLLIVIVPSAETLQAQLFNPGTHSRRLSSADRDSSTGVSNLFGAELGVRQSRGTGAFVGADRTDDTGFVGANPLIVPVPLVAATESLQAEVIQNSNEALATQTAAGIYSPRLVIAFSPVAIVQTPRLPEVSSPNLPPGAMQLSPQRGVIPPLLVDSSQRVQEHLAKTLGSERLGPIQVSVENRIATLRGSVASADDRSLAELVASFEPGVDQVRNELTVPTQSSTSRE